MSIASPTLRSSSRIEPWLSCSSWATDRLERPSTAEMFTGTSKTEARSCALFSSSGAVSGSAPSSGANSSSLRSSSAMFLAFAGRDQGFGVQALGGERRLQDLGDALGGGGGIERRAAVAEVEGEGVAGHGGIGLDHERAGVAAGLGAFLERLLQRLGEVGLGGDDQARRRRDLLRQGFDGGGQGRGRKTL